MKENGMSGGRRTLLECMPRRTVFLMLNYLSMGDIVSLLCADKRLRPFVNAPHFAPWRKRWHKFSHAEAIYERCVKTGEEVGDAEHRFVQLYTDALTSTRLSRPPLQLHEILHSIVHQDFVEVNAAQLFLGAWILGRVSAFEAFVRFGSSIAVELLYFARVFFAVLRLSRHFATGTSHRPYHQIIHALDAEAASELNCFFAPQRMMNLQGALTMEQERFVSYPIQRDDLVCVQAYAGTGKTRCLLAFAQRRPRAKFLYITFNAATARSARSQFPSNVECRTMHAVALRQVQLPEKQPLGTLRPRDIVHLLRGQMPEGRRVKDDAQPEKLAASSVATYILRTLDRFLQSADAHIRADKHVPRQLQQYTDLSPGDVASCAATLWDLICVGRTPRGSPVPCPHDAYVKLLQLHGTGHAFAEYTALLLDEAQDLSACQTAILLRARGACAIVVVGDVHQKIYGFRGGSAAAFHARNYPPSARFQLTQSFRFGPQVASVASSILCIKESPSWAPRLPPPRLDGMGKDCVQVSISGKMDQVPRTQIYRTNALLAHDALHLAATVGTSLFLQTSQAMQPTALAALLRDARTLYQGDSPLPMNSALREFAAWKELVEHVEADDGGGDSKLALVVSLAGLLGAPDFLQHVNQLEQCCCTSAEDADIVMTTVHQAKGLEWDRVVLADDFSPSYDASTPSLHPRVANLTACDEVSHMYVALTRARRHLVIPPCVYAWLIAKQGLFRFRYAEKSHKNKCPLCGTQRVAMIWICERYASMSADCMLYNSSPDFDTQCTSLGCLPCIRARLGIDAELEDFVRWIDGSGVSTTTGRLTYAAATRTTKKHQSTRSSELALSSSPLSNSNDRTSMYASLLDECKISVRRWYDARNGWLAECMSATPLPTPEQSSAMDESV
ncbi:DNA helicase [Malassezia psittaci]|uniref:DNA 3'-5' helicase n=1 Tax=Malassezia psittaci TaxID=1821823 RepID=A0AAF0FC31_9BASI|nr:DNA helicase [Malassezia psittaci]